MSPQLFWVSVHNYETLWVLGKGSALKPDWIYPPWTQAEPDPFTSLETSQITFLNYEMRHAGGASQIKWRLVN